MNAQMTRLTSVVSTLIALQILTLLILVGGGLYFFQQLKLHMSLVTTNSNQPAVPQNVENWQALERDHNATQGSENAELVVIEFSDFQCPFCKRYSDGTRPTLLTRYGDDIRMVFKHLPLEQIHPQAMTAAIAAQCARREGEFWEAHERLFDDPADLSIDSIIAIGESLGLGNRYATCVANEETRQEVEQDMEDAFEAGIQATPTFLVNGKVMVGAQTAAAFAAAFQEAGMAIE